MIIQSITLVNFQCYFGENTFEFSKGLNVIIGDNGFGKSKLYDAFYWILYDEAFDSSERKSKKTNEFKSKLISDKAKAICEPGGKVVTSVEISIINEEEEEEYIITRTYTIKRKETNNIQEFVWEEPESSQLNFQKKTKKSKGQFFKEQFRVEEGIKKILPPDIKPYIWFQGEQVDSLIDFKNVDTITRAVNALSDIREFDIFMNITKKASESAYSELRKERRRLSKDAGRSDELEVEKNELEMLIDLKEKELQDHRDGLIYAQERQNQLQGQFDTAGEIQKLNREENKLITEIQKWDEELKLLTLSINKNLFNKFWALKGTEELVISFEEKFGAYEKKRLENKIEQEIRIEIENEVIKTFQKRLPKNVPEPEYVKWMLEEQRCLVCDREAPTNSEPWLKIKDLLDHKEPKPLKNYVSQGGPYNFQEEFKSLYQNGLRMQARMENMNEEISIVFENIIKARQQRKYIKEELIHIQNQINEFIDSSSITSLQSVDILNEFKGQQREIRTRDRKILDCEVEIEQAKKRIKEINEDLKGLIKGQISPILTEKVGILEDFKTIAASTRERVFNRLIRQLEEEANKHYTSMTSESKAVRGRIRLAEQPNGRSYIPKIYDTEGREMHSINDSNIILIKMSVIMAIISAKKNTSMTQLYPLISDAPTSKFTENYTIGFCRTVSEVFSQSIIMSKEFYLNHALRDRLLNEVHMLGNVYIIEPSVPEGRRDNRNDLETNIVNIKRKN